MDAGSRRQRFLAEPPFAAQGSHGLAETSKRVSTFRILHVLYGGAMMPIRRQTISSDLAAPETNNCLTSGIWGPYTLLSGRRANHDHRDDAPNA
jgi:hypothetical protein